MSKVKDRQGLEAAREEPSVMVPAEPAAEPRETVGVAQEWHKALSVRAGRGTPSRLTAFHQWRNKDSDRQKLMGFLTTGRAGGAKGNRKWSESSRGPYGSVDTEAAM